MKNNSNNLASYLEDITVIKGHLNKCEFKIIYDAFLSCEQRTTYPMNRKPFQGKTLYSLEK